MTEKEYSKLKKGYIVAAENGDYKALQALKILEELWSAQLNNEQTRELRAREQSLREDSLPSEEEKKQAAKHADALARAEKMSKIWSWLGPVLGAGVTGATTVAVTVLNNRQKNLAVDAITAFEKDGTPTSLVAKTVLTQDLK